MQDDFVVKELLAADREISERLAAGDARMSRIEAELRVATQTVDAVKADTSEIVEAFDAMKGAFKVLNWIGSFARPVAGIVALAAALWGLWSAVRGIK